MLAKLGEMHANKMTVPEQEIDFEIKRGRLPEKFIFDGSRCVEADRLIEGGNVEKLRSILAFSNNFPCKNCNRPKHCKYMKGRDIHAIASIK